MLDNTYTQLFTKEIPLNYLAKKLPLEGFLAWEYNPFRNYRISNDKYDGNVLKYKKGLLVDFDTEELLFDINHPVNILPQYSYDGSVNLILNDGLNTPRLINSRFSPVGKNQYQIIDRTGTSDTNIYDSGNQFDIDTSLYKRTSKIPNLAFIGTYNGGNLPIGNYHFYFKLLDADENSTDFIAESGLVSVFIGNVPSGIKSGFRNENSNKLVLFRLSDIDSAYPYVEVYYSRATSDPRQNYIKEAVRINKKFIINNAQSCDIIITGMEETEPIPTSDLNLQYNIVDSAVTLATCQNMLFLGNVQKPKINYKELLDIALRFCPAAYYEKYNPEIDEQYRITNIENSYYNSKFIYNKTGYWPEEIYRIGVVFILSDNSLSPVFNIRGKLNLTESSNFEKINFFDESGNRQYISYDEITGYLSEYPDENAKGIISIKDNNFISILGIRIECKNEEIIEKLKELNIKGYFFVRLTRIPITICQALTIGTDKESNTIIPAVGGNLLKLVTVNNKDLVEDKEYCFITERYLNNNRELDLNFINRLHFVNKASIKNNAAICPEYDVNQEYLNSFFLGDEMILEYANMLPKNSYLQSSNSNHRHFYNSSLDYVYNDLNILITSKVVGIPDNAKLIVLDSLNKFSARAGSAEEVQRFEFIGSENKITEATNLLRGVYGPFIGFSEDLLLNKLINIKAKNSLLSSDELIQIRVLDNSSYFAISDRMPLENEFNSLVLFRGDCYISLFTHRINRNFNDPSAPYNDKIVNKNCWKDNFKYDHEVIKTDGLSKINLGDLNAILMGMWITFTLRTNSNLNVRSTDDTWIEESIQAGHSRGFYPLHDMSASGAYKLPEALCFNKGFSVSVSERYNFTVPDAPYYKNEFTNRILYSDIHINDAFKNGFRVFKSTNYRDYPKTYGQITKLIEVGGNLICVFEHGIALIPVNERAVAALGAGGNVFINTSNVLPENPKIISDSYGSQWQDSILKTPNFVYGVDTIAKKIWKTDGNTFECISDFKVLEFLNNNISLGERENIPIIGIRNVKTFYNAFKLDVMFTFYDNTYGFEEKVWNLCYNETMNKFITFYSWVPSLMENINNIPFSFDRNVSKWIAKLGTSHANNSFADGITLSEVVIPNNYIIGSEQITPSWTFNYKYINKQDEEVTKEFTIENENKILGNFVGVLSLSNRILPVVPYQVKYEICRDTYLNYLNFDIVLIGTLKAEEDAKFTNDIPIYALKIVYGNYKWGKVYDNSRDYVYESKVSEDNYVYIKEYDGNINSLLTELYYRNKDNHSYSDYESSKCSYLSDNMSINYIVNKKYPIYKSINGKRPMLDIKDLLNPNKIASLLNIRANIEIISNNSENANYSEDYYNYKAGFTPGTSLIDAGYYESTIAVIPEWNKQFLTSDFWKHGLAGLIDIADEIYPTNWYGKQHPFEFECIVVNDPSVHKIFTNLELVANKAKPESFHYEIIGESYDFAKDKVNMYFRQEARKALWLYNGADICYDRNFLKVLPKQQPKSADLIHSYYGRKDTINEIEDFYVGQTYPEGYDYRHLSGSEIVYYPNRQEYRIWSHSMAVSMDDLLDTTNYWNKSNGITTNYTDKDGNICRNLDDYSKSNSYSGGRSIIGANCQYLEDRWNITINPILVCYKNEYVKSNNTYLFNPINSTWAKNKTLPKIPIYNSAVPTMVIKHTNGNLSYPFKWDENGKQIEYPIFDKDNALYGLYSLEDEVNLRNILDEKSWILDSSTYGYNFGKDQNRKEIDLKDKFIKVRIRYSGNELAVIDFLRTVYRISFS